MARAGGLRCSIARIAGQDQGRLILNASCLERRGRSEDWRRGAAAIDSGGGGELRIVEVRGLGLQVLQQLLALNPARELGRSEVRVELRELLDGDA